MKPILYESTETLFQSNGLGVLSDCISAHVVEERNGQYEAEFEYPVDGIHYSDIVEGRIILISHDESGDLQPFDIYGHSKTINGVTTFFAHHIAYRQNGITVKPFTASSLSQALTKIKSNSINSNPFNYSTDKSVSASFQLANPKPLRSILGGEEGSLLDVYGTGEYEWDRFQVILHLHRGTDSGVVVRYGKNLISLQDDIDFSDSYNGIVPFWFGQTSPTDGSEAVETLVTLSEWVVYKSGSTYDGRNTVIPVDLSSQFQTVPTEAQLRSAAQSYLNKGNPLLPKDTLTFDFVELSQTQEYSYMSLQQVNLCDTVKVIYDDIDTTMKVISVDWDVLNERYNSLTLGDAPATYAQVITDRLASIAETANEGAKLAKLWATNALSIAGNTDQYFWFTGTGTDTGAHITEKPKNTFLADPTHGGGNLIARSNGIAARNGLVELATFGANGSRVGLAGGAAVTTQTDGIRLFDGAGNNCAFFGVDGNNPSIRVGKTDLNGHIRITPTSGVRFLRDDDTTIMAQLASDGLQIWKNNGTNNISVAFFGGISRVGDADDGHVTIASDGFQVYRKVSGDTDPVSIGYFGIYRGKGWARIGALGENHINVDGTYNGIELFRKLDTDQTPVSAAWFGSTTRLGANDEARVIIAPTYFNIYNNQNDTTFSIGLASSSMTYNRYIYSSYLSSSVEITLPNIANGTTVYIESEAGGAITSASFTVGTASTGVDYSYDGNKTLTLNPSSGAYYSVYYSVTANPPIWTLGTRIGGRGGFSAVVGLSNKASGTYSMAIGNQTEATGLASFASGRWSKASGNYAFAQGQSTRATGESQTVIGKHNATDSTKAFIIGNGTGQDLDPNQKRNALTVDWNGNLVASGTLKGSGWQGDLAVSGDIYAGGHDTAIGWYDAHFNSASIPSGVSYDKLSASEIELTPGRYVVTGTLGYSGAETGYRAIGFVTRVVGSSADTTIYESRHIVPTIPSTSWRTYVSTTHIISVEQKTKIYLTTMQNCGVPLSTDWYIKAIRIK